MALPLAVEGQRCSATRRAMVCRHSPQPTARLRRSRRSRRQPVKPVRAKAADRTLIAVADPRQRLNNKNPPRVSLRRVLLIDHRVEKKSVLGRPGSDLLFQALRLSTIGAEGFNGRVRDGNGFRPPAKTTRSAKDGFASWSSFQCRPFGSPSFETRRFAATLLRMRLS